MRATAILSGPMLKFWMVWWMSWVGGFVLLALMSCCFGLQRWGKWSYSRWILFEKHLD